MIEYLKLGAVILRKNQKLIIGFILGAAVIFVVYDILKNWEEFSQYNWQFNQTSLLISFLAYSLSLILTIVVWGAIVKQLGGRMSFINNLKFYSYSNLARHLPTALWYIGTRVYLYQKGGMAKSVTATAIFLETVVIFFSGTIVYLLSLPFGLSLSQIEGKNWLMLAAIPVLAIGVRPSLLENMVNFMMVRLGRSKLSVAVEGRNMLQWIAVFSFIWILGGGIIFFLGNGIYQMDPTTLPVMVNIWVLAGLIGQIASFLPIQFALREITLSYLLSFFVPLHVAIAVSVLIRLWLAVINIFWALIFSRL